MDSLTHLLLGHTMGAAAAGGAGTAAYWGALVGNSLPDIDVPAGYAVRKGWAFHRKYTHTAPGIVLLCAVAAAIISSFFPDDPPLLTFGWTLAGAVVHVLLDCLNVRGTRALWPFTNRVFGYAVLFIIDPYMLAIHGLATVAAPLGAVWAPAAAWAATAGYIALRLALRETVRSSLPEGAVHTVWPIMGGLNRWRYITDSPDALEWGTARALPFRHIASDRIEKPRHPAVEASRALPTVDGFLARARLPYATVEQAEHGYTVTWSDLTARLRGRTLQVRVRLDPYMQELP